MMTLIGYTQSVDQAALGAIAGIADPHVRVAGNDIYVPDFASKVVGVYAFGPSITQAQLRSPSILRRYALEVEELDVAAIPSSPIPYLDLWENPLDLDPTEPLEAWTSENGAGATRQSVLVWLSDGRQEASKGEAFTARATTVLNLVANAWTNGALTFATNLPAGMYDVVGARAESTNMQAFRLVFPGAAHRPGGLGAASAGRLLDTLRRFRFGRAGVWGSFSNIVPPTVDFLANAADANPTVWLDLVKR